MKRNNNLWRSVRGFREISSGWFNKGVTATLGAAFLLLSVACASAESEQPVTERGSELAAPQSRVVTMPAAPAQEPASAPPAAPMMESAPAQQSQPASAPAQPKIVAPAAQSQPSSSASQGAQSGQPDSPNTAARRGPRNIPRDTATTGPQPLVSSSLDPISTFSLDTDRASFQRALQETQDGYQIDPADVRAEEWINSLNYDYPKPSRPDEFAVHTEVFQHPDTQGMHLAQVGIQAPDAQKRRIVNVTLVIDTSGSMREGNRIAIAERAVQTILDNLRDRDRVAVVKFEDTVTFVQDHTSPRSARSNREITTLWPGGSTNVQAGLDEALWLADQARRDTPEAVIT